MSNTERERARRVRENKVSANEFTTQQNWIGNTKRIPTRENVFLINIPVVKWPNSGKRWRKPFKQYMKTSDDFCLSCNLLRATKWNVPYFVRNLSVSILVYFRFCHIVEIHSYQSHKTMDRMWLFSKQKPLLELWQLNSALQYTVSHDFRFILLTFA